MKPTSIARSSAAEAPVRAAWGAMITQVGICSSQGRKRPLARKRSRKAERSEERAQGAARSRRPRNTPAARAQRQRRGRPATVPSSAQNSSSASAHAAALVAGQAACAAIVGRLSRSTCGHPVERGAARRAAPPGPGPERARARPRRGRDALGEPARSGRGFARRCWPAALYMAAFALQRHPARPPAGTSRIRPGRCRRRSGAIAWPAARASPPPTRLRSSCARCGSDSASAVKSFTTAAGGRGPARSRSASDREAPVVVGHRHRVARRPGWRCRRRRSRARRGAPSAASQARNGRLRARVQSAQRQRARLRLVRRARRLDEGEARVRAADVGDEARVGGGGQGSGWSQLCHAAPRLEGV